MDGGGDQTGQAGRGGVLARLFPSGAALVCILVIGLTFLGGINRGMDKALSFGPQSEENAMAVAISELVYGFRGYVAHYTVLEALEGAIHRGAQNANDPQILPNLRNGALINEGIANAISLGPRNHVYVSDGGLRTMVYDDIGIVDFMKLAFRLFGFEVQSFYYLFFAILVLSSSAFFVQFRDKPVALVHLFCILSAFLIELHTPIFTRDMPSFWGMRHGSTLALVPTWHLALLLYYRSKISVVSLGLAVIQILVLILAIKMRGSAFWAVLFLAGVVIYMAWFAWRELPSVDRSWKALGSKLVRWPIIAVFLGLAAGNVVTNARLHPAYFTDDILPFHGAWHSAFLGLNISPTFWPLTGVKAPPEKYFDRTVDTGALADRLAYDAAIRRVQELGFIGTEGEYVSPWTKTYRMRLHDHIMRGMVIETLLGSPLAAVALYAYWKPRQILLTLEILLAGMSKEVWIAMVSGMLLLALALVATHPRVSARDFLPLLYLAAGCVVFSGAPNLWAYAALHAMADLLLSVFVLMGIAGTAIFVFLLQRVRQGLGGRLSTR